VLADQVWPSATACALLECNNTACRGPGQGWHRLSDAVNGMPDAYAATRSRLIALKTWVATMQPKTPPSTSDTTTPATSYEQRVPTRPPRSSQS